VLRAQALAPPPVVQQEQLAPQVPLGQAPQELEQQQVLLARQVLEQPALRRQAQLELLRLGVQLQRVRQWVRLQLPLRLVQLPRSVQR
jgi:hypothetical protein